jgi:hypothetical protein
MNQIDLIKRGWALTWRFRGLWIFGILLALTSGGGGGGGSGGSPAGPRMGSVPGLNGPGWAALASIILLCCCLVLIAIIVAVIVQYVSRAALYRMVDGIETTGAAPSWREGFRLGWTNRTFRMFLLDVLVAIPVVIVILLLIGLTVAPVLLFGNAGGGLRTLGILLTVGLGLVSILIVLIIAVAVSLLRQFWSRLIVIGNASLGQAFAESLSLVWNRLGSVGLLWLLMVGIGLLFFVVTLPLLIALIFIGVAIGGGLGWALYTLTDSVALGVLTGLPLFLAILIIPMSLARGIYLTWETSTWTLAYREVTGAATPQAAVAPVEA